MSASLELKEMNYEHCPYCGARIVNIMQKTKHCNGHWNEYVQFECGCEIYFSPNFRREEIQRPCPKSPEEIEFQDKRKKAKKKLIEFINKLNVDEQYKQNLFRGIGIY